MYDAYDKVKQDYFEEIERFEFKGFDNNTEEKIIKGYLNKLILGHTNSMKINL